jgi:hypothetical protein
LESALGSQSTQQVQAESEYESTKLAITLQQEELANRLATLNLTRLAERARDAQLTADIKAATLKNRAPEIVADLVTTPSQEGVSNPAAPVVFTHEMNAVVAAAISAQLDLVCAEDQFLEHGGAIRAACSQIVLRSGYAAAQQAASAASLASAATSSGSASPDSPPPGGKGAPARQGKSTASEPRPPRAAKAKAKMTGITTETNKRLLEEGPDDEEVE